MDPTSSTDQYIMSLSNPNLAKQLTMTVLTTPDMVNFSGKVHGGALLKLLDEVAYACASRYCGHYVVTLSADRVTFRQPVHLGELVTFLANVNYTGRTSMEVGIKVIAEDTKKRTVRHTLSCFFTMVALDEHGKSMEVPQLPLETPKDKDRFEDAKIRKQLREEFEKRHAEIIKARTK